MTIMPIVRIASENFGILKARHVRAARALLDWTQEDLAKRASVVRRTIVSVETGSSRCRPCKIQAMLAAFKAAGIDFVFGPDGVVSLIDSTSNPLPTFGSEAIHFGEGNSGAPASTARPAESPLNTRVSGRRRNAG